MDKIQQAKILLKKAIMLDDAELMAMANQILEEAVQLEAAQPATPSVSDPVQPYPEPVQVVAQEQALLAEETPPAKRQSNNRDTSLGLDFDQFKMKNDEELSRKNGVAVNKIKREITFVDDGSDKHIQTPEITRANRARKPFSKIEQICQKCGRTVKTHPSHKREWFVCDGCIRK